MAARSKARKRALDILFECEVRATPLGETLDDRVLANEPPVNAYTVTLIRGVIEHQARIDEVISTYAQGWSLERMPIVDRNVLRLGVYELLYVDDVPDGVAVSEAMSLVRELSTDELTARQVRLNLGGSVHDPTDPVGRLLFNVLAMVAEFEADLIRLRTKEGMRVAKAKGRLRGKQPKLNPRQEAHLVALLKSGEYSTAEIGDLFGVARSTVYRAIGREAARQRAQRSTAAPIR